MIEKNKIEKYAEKVLKENGYEVEILKRYFSKTVYLVKTNCFEEKVEIPCCVSDEKTYMKIVVNTLKLKAELLSG